jgi:hypothetical protein
LLIFVGSIPDLSELMVTDRACQRIARFSLLAAMLTIWIEWLFRLLSDLVKAQLYKHKSDTYIARCTPWSKMHLWAECATRLKKLSRKGSIHKRS